VALQAQYSLIVRELEREHVPLCQAHGLGILPWSPLAGGFLTGKYRKDQPPPTGTRMEKTKEILAGFDRPRNWRTLDAVTAIARELGSTPAAVSLAWLLRRPAVTSVIFGARSVQQLDDSVQAATLQLPAELVKRLDEASAFEVGYPYDFIQRVQGRW
jgi:aryl-alcohol dehydrogenase-like predicted oxidoreductase